MITKKELHGISQGEFWSSNGLWLVSFVLVLPVAALAQLTGWRWKPWIPSHSSAIREARSAADRIVHLSFSGL